MRVRENKCIVCGKLYTTKRSHSVYCGKACANVAWYRKRVSKIKYCAKCGTVLGDSRSKMCSACKTVCKSLASGGRRSLTQLELDALDMVERGYGYHYGNYIRDKEGGKLNDLSL